MQSHLVARPFNVPAILAAKAATATIKPPVVTKSRPRKIVGTPSRSADAASCPFRYAMRTFFGITPELACYNEAAARDPTILDHMREGLRPGQEFFHARRPSAGPSRRLSAQGKRSPDKVH
jgi:hypothetical protein